MIVNDSIIIKIMKSYLGQLLQIWETARPGNSYLLVLLFISTEENLQSEKAQKLKAKTHFLAHTRQAPVVYIISMLNL